VTIRLAEGSLVVLVGPPGSGKSTWSGEQFPPNQVVSSDRVRALVGEGEHD
jgi:predicted kinase